VPELPLEDEALMATVKEATEAPRWKKAFGSWQVRYGHLHVSVHNFLGCGDQIYVTCYSVGIEQLPLETKDWKEARAQALRVVEGYLKDRAREASELCVNAQEP
jgi:hypothetical protein